MQHQQVSEKESTIKARYRLLSTKIIRNLKSRKFDAYYCDTTSDARQKTLLLIPKSASVSWGGSVTLEEFGLLEELYQGHFIVIDRDKASNADER